MVRLAQVRSLCGPRETCDNLSLGRERWADSRVLFIYFYLFIFCSGVWPARQVLYHLRYAPSPFVH
jgi:hypothetical protein